MPATLTLTADSARVPGLDGFVTTAGALDTAGDLTFQKATADTTTAWITFENVPLDKFRRFGPGFDKASQSWPDTPVVLRLTPSAAAAEAIDLTLTIRAILEQTPAAIASPADLSGRTLTTQSVVWVLPAPADTDPIESPDLSPILNEVLEHFPADGRPRSITLVISVAAAGDQALSVKSGEGAGAPELDVVFHSILNQWRGDASEETGRLKVTVLEAVPYAYYSIDFGGNQVFGYRATTVDTTATIAAALSNLIGVRYTIEYTDGEDSFVVVSSDPGQPFDFQFPLVPKSVVEVVQEGRRPTAQQTRITLPAPVEGSTLTGTWSVTFDFGNGAETLATVAAAASAGTLQTAIEGLTTPVPGDIQVDVENVLPRTYLVTFQGALAGLPVTVTASGNNLIGCATATIETVQRPGREIHDVFLIWVEQYAALTEPWAFRISMNWGNGPQLGSTVHPLLTAGSAAWTTFLESHFGAGNVRATVHVSNTPVLTDKYLAAVMIEFLGDEAGIDHDGGFWEVFSDPQLLVQGIQLQSGEGSVSNEYVLLAPAGITAQYTLTVGAETTGNIGLQAPDDIVDALVALTGVAAGDVEVLLPFGLTTTPIKDAGLAVLKFQQAFDNTNVPDLRPANVDGDLVDYSREIDAAVATNEIQVISWAGSTVHLYLGSGFAGIELTNATSEATMQDLFEAQYGDGNVDVFKIAPGDAVMTAVAVRFKGSRAGTTQQLIQFSPSVGDAEGEIFRLQDRTEAGLQWQVVSIPYNVAPVRDNWADFANTGYRLTLESGDSGQIEFYNVEQAAEKAGAARAVTLPDPLWSVMFLGFDVAQDLVAVNEVNSYSASIVQGSPLLNEIQRVTVRAGGGTLRVKHDAEAWSTAFAWPASTAAWQTALDETAGADNTIASGLGSPSSPLTVEFIGDFETTEVPLLQVDTASLTGNAPIASTLVRSPIVGLDEIQRVVVDPSATGGSIRIGLDGRFSGAIAWNAAAATVETALDATPGIGADNTSVEGAAGSPWLVTFIGDLAKQPIALLTLDQDALIVAGTVMDVELLTPGAGPNYYATAANWSLGRVPQTHDVVDFGPGRVDVTAGLVQRIRVLVEIPEGDDSVTELATDGLADLVDGQIVRLYSSSGEFPEAELGGDAITLDAATDYYLTSASRIDRTLTLATSRDGDAIEFTSSPNGDLYVEVCLSQLRHQMSYTGKIGLPPRTTDGLFEDKPQSLQTGFLPSRLGVPNLQLGIGEGSGSNRINLDAGVSPLKAEIINTGGAVGDYPPVLIDGTSDLNEFLQVQGEIGLGLLSGRTAWFTRIQLMAGRISMGADVHAAEGASIDVFAGGQLLATDLVTRKCNVRIRGQ